MTPLNWIITYRDRLINRHRMSVEQADMIADSLLDDVIWPWRHSDPIEAADRDIKDGQS